jgi:hypothetical protein
MPNTTAPLADADAATIADALVELHQDISHARTRCVADRDSMLASIQGATMRLRIGQVARAGEIADILRANLWRIGL